MTVYDLMKEKEDCMNVNEFTEMFQAFATAYGMSLRLMKSKIPDDDTLLKTFLEQEVVQLGDTYCLVSREVNQ
jgi:hypothetical protein